MSKDSFLWITIALPYANGPLHLGHILEGIQADIWCRYHKKLAYKKCYFLCADDTHGTPIMLKAEEEGITPQELVEIISQKHQADFRGFLIDFDYYGSTDDEFSFQQAQSIYLTLKEKGFIEERTIQQLYDPQKEFFLPDRYVKGECPFCHAQDQYGDNCEPCGATYSSADLVNPYSVLSGSEVIWKDSQHFFLLLSHPQCVEYLRSWICASMSPEVANKVYEWLGKEGEEAKLVDWDISRDEPYLGIPIPGEAGKFFYVWLDAPIGYMSSCYRWCQKNNIDFNSVWSSESKDELYHFIGKDIIYFHALFWPAMLHISGYRSPTKVFVHGFLNFNGGKMSKSRGTLISAHQYLERGLSPEYLRYYFACRLNSGMQDIDFDQADFIQRINSDLIGKYINIASRCAKLLEKHHGSIVLELMKIKDKELLALEAHCADMYSQIAGFYESREYSQAMRAIITLAGEVNRVLESKKPWSSECDREEAHAVCSVSLRAFILITFYFLPVLPQTAEYILSEWLEINQEVWSHKMLDTLPELSLKTYVPLMTRVDASMLKGL